MFIYALVQTQIFLNFFFQINRRFEADQILAGDGDDPEGRGWAVEARPLVVSLDQDPILDDDVADELVENGSLVAGIKNSFYSIINADSKEVIWVGG